MTAVGKEKGETAGVVYALDSGKVDGPAVGAIAAMIKTKEDYPR